MKIKVSEATALQLDWLVTTIEFPKGSYGGEAEHYSGNGGERWIRIPDKKNRTYVLANYSTNWAQGGPIIEREGINTYQVQDGTWQGNLDYGMTDELIYWGPTPLIAAMRCFVVSKMGDEVDVPEELI